ncbi:MAG: prephenate dehydratase, partial [Acidobacteria bacterium]|nr:prephenate dehydratase [Acidobacteriota bacterium]
ARGTGLRMELDELRNRIDQIDAQLVALLNERARCAVDVGRVKRDAGQESVYSPGREREVLERVLAANKGPLADRTLLAIWKEMMSGSLSLEKAVKVAYLGPEGSFSHLAALEKFGHSVELVAVRDISAVFDQVARAGVDYGIAPVENTTGGAVRDTMECFLWVHGPVQVCAELALPIHQNLLSKTTIEGIQKVYSKPQVFDQCRQWLIQNLGQADLVAVGSTAEAALLASRVAGTAAIASSMAAEIYGLDVLSAAIEDNPQNQTRFIVLGRESPQPTGRDKTCLLFSVMHKAGALVEVLDIFRRHGLNMTKIESHPLPTKTWEYYFFVDIEGHADDENVRQAMNEARQHCRQLETLGSFPVAVSAE